MTQWTPEIESLISRYGDYEETQVRDGINPKASMLGSILRIQFRYITTGLPLYRDICKALDVETGLGKSALEEKAIYQANMALVIFLARQNRSSAADKLIRADEIQTMLAMRRDDPVERIRYAKTLNLTF